MSPERQFLFESDFIQTYDRWRQAIADISYPPSTKEAWDEMNKGRDLLWARLQVLLKEKNEA